MKTLARQIANSEIWPIGRLSGQCGRSTFLHQDRGGAVGLTDPPSVANDEGQKTARLPECTRLGVITGIDPAFTEW